MTYDGPYTRLASEGEAPPLVGHAPITMVEPHPGHEREYKRWYEDDHLISGAMDHPSMFAGRRWVATRDLQVHDPDRLALTDREPTHLAAANRDPSAFDYPDTLDVTRKNARQHVGLRFGIHTCLGQWLTRLETEVALTELLRRYPDHRIVSEHHMRRNVTLHGPARLHLSA